MTTNDTPEVLPGYTVSRWRRYGHDRAYVTWVGDGADRQLGYRDLASGRDHADDPADVATVGAVCDAWACEQDGRGGPAPVRAAPTPVEPSAAPAHPEPAPVVVPAAEVIPAAPAAPWTDLSLNRAGDGVRLEEQAARAGAPVKTLVARALGVHTDERAWRLGRKGEELVGKQLDRLAARDARWTAIHAIRVGTRGADIDHLVIGPGGVFTLNTKHHPDADIWVGGETFLVNGSRVPYVRNARHEAERAARLLTTAVGAPVVVTGLVVPVGCNAPVTVKAPPKDVHVVTRRDLVGWFSRLGPTLGDPDLARVWDAARRSTTWTA
jgi:hypothetical protein